MTIALSTLQKEKNKADITSLLVKKMADCSDSPNCLPEALSKFCQEIVLHLDPKALTQEVSQCARVYCNVLCSRNEITHLVMKDMYQLCLERPGDPRIHSRSMLIKGLSIDEVKENINKPILKNAIVKAFGKKQSGGINEKEIDGMDVS